VFPEAPKPDLFLLLYFSLLGFCSSLIFFLVLSTMHCFKATYPDYAYSFYSMAAVKFPIFITLFVIRFVGNFSYSLQIVGGLIGSLLGFIGTVQASRVFPKTGTGLAVTLTFQSVGAVCTFVFQAIAVRVASYYSTEVYAYYYAQAAFACVVTSGLGMFMVWEGVDIQTSVNVIMAIAILFYGGTAAVHLAFVRTDPYFRDHINARRKLQTVRFWKLADVYSIIKGKFWTLAIILCLLAITYRTVFFEICPSTIDYGLWVNAVTIGSNCAEFVGRYTGDVPTMSWIVKWFHWYPWVYTAVICWVYLWGAQSVRDSLWGLLWILMLAVAFRTGICITYYVVAAMGDAHEPNAAMIMNYGKEFGAAIGALISLGVVALKAHIK